MEGHCLTGQSPQWDVVPLEEEVDGTTPIPPICPNGMNSDNFIFFHLHQIFTQSLAVYYHVGLAVMCRTCNC